MYLISVKVDLMTVDKTVQLFILIHKLKKAIYKSKIRNLVYFTNHQKYNNIIQNSCFQYITYL